MLRIVCDTNILISGLLFGGIPGQVYDAGTRTRQYLLLRSQPLVDELRRVLNYSKFEQWLERADLEIDALLYDFVNASLPAPLATIPPDAVTDLKDMHILALAVGAHADYIVTSDRRHLLSLRSYSGIPIITAAQFLEILASAAR